MLCYMFINSGGGQVSLSYIFEVHRTVDNRLLF